MSITKYCRKYYKDISIQKHDLGYYCKVSLIGECEESKCIYHSLNERTIFADVTKGFLEGKLSMQVLEMNMERFDKINCCIDRKPIPEPKNVLSNLSEIEGKLKKDNPKKRKYNYKDWWKFWN